MRPRFFSLPPVPWPYILINLNRPTIGYVRRYKKHIEAILIDSGIEIFRRSNTYDYPDGFQGQLIRALKLRDKLRGMGIRVPIYITIADYCDDYKHMALWQDDYTNIERTLWSIFYALDNYPYKYYLIPIQGYNEVPSSIEKTLEYLELSGILKTHRYYAIANLCVSRRIDTIVRTLKIARTWLRNKYVHAFGINLRAIRYVHNLIDSFDSMAWTRPVNTKKLKANWSCKNKQERIRFFHAWIERLNKILNNQKITNYLKEKDLCGLS